MNVALKTRIVIAFLFAGLPILFGQSVTIAVKPFTKVIISPHIEVNLMAGDRETVVLENVEVPREKRWLKEPCEYIWMMPRCIPKVKK